MEYHEIFNDLEPRVTGIRTGTSSSRISTKVFEGKEWLNGFLYGNGSGYRRGDFPPKDFKLELPLDKPAKLIDFISVGAILSGFVVSKKVLKIIESCNLPSYKAYKITFHRGETLIEGYYWLYYNLFDGSSFINYSKSIFDTKDEEETFNQKFSINNYEDYIDLSKRMNRGVHPKRIVFDKTFDKEIDLFGMRFFGSRNYISERLKKKFEENEITGYKLLYPPTDPELEWE